MTRSPSQAAWSTARPVVDTGIAREGLKSVTALRYVAYRQAPRPAASVSPIGAVWSAGNIHRLQGSEPPIPGSSPGVGEHAPSQGQVVVGEGPVQSTGLSGTLELSKNLALRGIVGWGVDPWKWRLAGIGEIASNWTHRWDQPPPPSRTPRRLRVSIGGSCRVPRSFDYSCYRLPRRG